MNPFELYIMSKVSPKHSKVAVHSDGRITVHSAVFSIKDLQADFGDISFVISAIGNGISLSYWGISYDYDEEVWKVGKETFKRLHEAFERSVFLIDKRDFFLKKIERDINKRKILV